MEVLRSSYGVYGFTPLDTPIIEASDVLLAKGGGETEKQIYRFSKGDSDLSLRFDLTVPLAKYVALHYADLAFPFRRFQIGKVYRGERAQRGRFREFYQADIDVIGDGELDITNDAEIPAIIYTVFSRLGLSRFQIRINNRRILNGFYAMLGLSDKSGDIMRTVDKIEKIGPDLVRAILVDDYAIEGEKADEILAFIGIKGTNEEVLASLEKYRGRNEMFDQGLDELTTVAKYLGAFGVPQENFAVDLTIARGLDYYTGTVYETTLLDHPEIGSVCSGGRYDNLAEYYTDRKLPGVGISIGVTRLFYVLGEQGLLNSDICTAPADVRARIGFLTSELKLEDFFTPNALYDFFSDLHGVPADVRRARRERLFERFGIGAFAEVRVGDLSTGMKQKVSLVISVVHDPDVIIFDEPTNGLDVITARVVTDFLRECRAAGKSILLSTHIFDLAEKLCDRVGVIIDGRMVRCDTLTAVKDGLSLEDRFFALYEQEGGRLA